MDLNRICKPETKISPVLECFAIVRSKHWIYILLSHSTAEESIKILRDWLGLGTAVRSADDIDEEDEKTRCTRVYALLQRMLSMREEGGGEEV